MSNSRLTPILATLFFCLLVNPCLASQEPKVRYIPADKLAAQLAETHIIDVRSRLEFSMLQIKGAVHIPSGTMMKEDLDRVLTKAPLFPLVFYCNGYD